MIEYIDFKIDFTNRNARVGGVTLDRVTTRNYDTAIRFRIEIIGHTLDDTYDVKILTKYHKSELSVMTTLGDSLEIVDGKLIYTPKVNLITEADYVRNYLYLSKDGLGLDMAQFNYQVDVSQIGEMAVEVKQVYDESYEVLLAEFEQALEDYKLTLPQADSVRAEIDVVLSQFGVDSQSAIGDLNDVSAAVEVAEASRINAEQARKEAEILREESYEQKVDTALVEADVVEKVDNKVTELTPRMNDLTAQLAQTKQELKTKRTHMTTLSDDTKIPFEIHNQAGQDGVDVSSEVTHHYTDATAKVIDNVGDGTILMLSNSQNTVMRPDKDEDFVGNGYMLRYRKFNNATKSYDEILNVDPKGNIERKAVDEPFSITVRKADNGYPAFSINSAVAQRYPVVFYNGGTFLSFIDEVDFTKPAIVSPASKTTGLELRAEAGSIYLQAPNGTVQIRFNDQLYQAQLVMAGATAQRPSTNLSNGRFYFDTTIGKPIWRLSTSATGWVDAMGDPA